MSKNLTPASTMPATVVVPLATELVSAMNLEVAAQALYNFCEALYDGKIIVASGVTMQVGAGGAFTCHGKAIFNGTGFNDTEIADADIEDADIDDLTVRIMDVTESIDLGSTAELTCPTGSNVALLGRKQNRPRIYMANVATVTIDTSQADEFVPVDNPTLANVIVLRAATAPIPREDETITLVIPAFYQSVGGVGYTIKRDDGPATIICTLVAEGGGVSTAVPVTMTFRFSSGVWRLGPTSGAYKFYNSAGGSTTLLGVVPGAGA